MNLIVWIFRKQDEAGEPTAADVLNALSVSQLTRILKVYGEECFARRIANAIVEYRTTLGPLCATTELADLIASVVEPLAHKYITFSH